HWVHVSHVQFKGQKMSKSLGNLIYVDELARASSPAAIRMMFSRHHYREGWDFNPVELQRAEEHLHIYQAAAQVGGELGMDEVNEYRSWFYDALDQDLDTPGAISVLDRLATDLSTRDQSINDLEGSDLIEE